MVEEVKKSKAQDSKENMIAKKDHVIFQNDYKLEIKKGDDLSKEVIPTQFIETLKTEKII